MTSYVYIPSFCPDLATNVRMHLNAAAVVSDGFAFVLLTPAAGK